MIKHKFSFNRVVIVCDEQVKEVTVDGFLELPMSDRIRYILRRQIQFYFDLSLIPSHQALAEIRNFYESK